MGMIVKAHIDDPAVIHKIEKLLKSKKYTSTTSLVLQAIQNLIEEEDEVVINSEESNTNKIITCLC